MADKGKDKNAFCSRKGVLLDYIESWSGKDATSDIFETVEKTFIICDSISVDSFHYDADGLGSGVRGDARVVNERRLQEGVRQIDVDSFRGSASVVNPDQDMVPGRTNKDFFANYKAQSWWHLRSLFLNTYRAINGKEYDPDELIAISGDIAELSTLCMELSQPTYKPKNGKILVDKMPDGATSPNLADSVMMNYAPKEKKARGFFDL